MSPEKAFEEKLFQTFLCRIRDTGTNETSLVNFFHYLHLFM